MQQDAWQPSNLSWSFSRKTHFESCKRHYFYHRFWGQDPKMRWRLFEMRNITTLMMLRGLVVHMVIADALNAARMGRIVDPAEGKRNVTETIRRLYQESAKRLWHIDNRPQGRKSSSITNLLEHYYRLPGTNERAREAQLSAWRSVENLLDSGFWRDIVQSDYSKWQEVESEGFPSFDLDGIQIYTRIDFAHSSGAPTIIDWKTGEPGPEDRKQLTLYSMYAHRKWEWDPSETRLAAVYLQPDLRIDVFSPTSDDIESLRAEVKQSFAEMMDVEPAYGPADIESFPMTEALSNCRWCRFQGVCSSKAAS